MSFAYYHATLRHIGNMFQHDYARACDPACKKYRSGEIKYFCVDIDKCMFVFATANNNIPYFIF